MQALKNWWDGFSQGHPRLAGWVREGGLFLLFSNLVKHTSEVCNWRLDASKQFSKKFFS